LLVSLTPGFSRVGQSAGTSSRFNGFPHGKTVETVFVIAINGTGLKPGVNEIRQSPLRS
jgi:hypothetical protein